MLTRLFPPESQTGSSARVLIIAAHPDDEVIGAGAQFPNWPDVHIVHVTDGAPRAMGDALWAGCAARAEYAAVRHRESQQALALAGVAADRLHQLGFVDQEAALDLPRLAHAVEALVREFDPDILITHPYEGGHPDHDATAFATQIASRQIAANARSKLCRIEMTSYYNEAGRMISGQFLPGAHCPTKKRILSPAQRVFKQRLFECFATQKRVLSGFGLDQEAFRVAPVYDFTQPPHAGQLYYEMFEWGMTGARWCALARNAFKQLELIPVLAGAPRRSEDTSRPLNR